MKVAGVVVLYNPSDGFIDNISSYVGQVDVLFAVDNSDSVRPEFERELTKFGNVTYHSMGGNAGMAAALNAGAELALKERCEYLLLMDQDSILPGSAIAVFTEYVSNSHRKIGIVYARHEYHNYHQSGQSDAAIDILTADTSGSFLNLSAYRDVGGFMNELFIDYVDFEYCLRLRKHGYEIVQLRDACLLQRLGAMTSSRFLFWTIGISNHSPVRVYYRVRNRLVVARLYVGDFPRWSLFQMLFTIVELFKIIIYEKEKLAKIGMMAMGVSHFVSHRYGPVRNA